MDPTQEKNYELPYQLKKYAKQKRSMPKEAEKFIKELPQKSLGPDNLISTFFPSFPKGQPQKV